MKYIESLFTTLDKVGKYREVGMAQTVASELDIII
jgi:hypothetical protein